jgi:ABC-2 type transport system ATP-binding protein
MISVEGVTKRFSQVLAVDRLSFEVNRGEVVGFLGPNGAGKTTTMRMITGTLQPDEGAVLFDESNPLYDEMLVAEYLDYVAELRGLSPRAARAHVSDAVDETDIGSVFYRPVGECSKGYRQRIGLAAAILHRPEVLVLDEPTEGLDPNQRIEIRRLVSSLGRERTVLLSTHVMQEVEATCSRLVILSRGRLAAKGSVHELIASRAGGVRYIVEAEGKDVPGGLSNLDGVTGHEVEAVDGRVRVRLEVAGSTELRPEIFRLAMNQDWTLWELHRERVSLEQVFRALTSEGSSSVDAPEGDHAAGGRGSEEVAG